MRLGDLFAWDPDGRKRLTWRELGVYVRQLPPTARTRLATGDREGLWGLAEHLTALLIDELRIGNWQRANSGAKPGQQSKPPRPVPRGGTGETAHDTEDAARIAAREAALQRAAERRAAIERGDIT